MRVSLVTLGDPAKQTGGYLYHRRLAEVAPRYDAGLTFRSLPEPFPVTLTAVPKVFAEASRSDVVVVDSIVTAFSAPWLPRVSTPLVGMLHQPPGGIDHGPLRTRLQAPLDRRAYRYMRTILVASEPLRQQIAGLHHDVRLVAPGRDVAGAPDAAGFDLRHGRDVALLCVANWVPRKGIIELVEAFAQIPPRAATLHLVGDDTVDRRYSSRVRRRLATLGTRVVVHGVVPKERVAALYRDAEVFIMPSYVEPYGTVYGEAMAAALPVIGWRAGNLPYLARHEHEGLIVEPGNVPDLARAIRRLCEDSQLRADLARSARERAQSFPTWEETAAAFFGALREVVKM